MIKKVVADWNNSTDLACTSAHPPFLFLPFQTTLLIRPVAPSLVSEEGNMSVYAHDELLRQSLQQSLCPNEKEFCSFIQSFIYFIFWFSLLASSAPNTQGVTKQEGLMTVIPLCQGRLDMLPPLALFSKPQYTSIKERYRTQSEAIGRDGMLSQ